MHSIKITGLSRIARPKANRGGSTVLAYFDCEANGFILHGCAFVRTKAAGLTVWTPKIEVPGKAVRAVEFTDCSLRHAVMLHAREAYRLMGGTDAEQVGKIIPNGPRSEAALAEEFADR